MGTCEGSKDPRTGCCESTKAALLFSPGGDYVPKGGAVAGAECVLALKTLKYCRGHAVSATIVPPAHLDAYLGVFQSPAFTFTKQKKAGSRIRGARAGGRAAARRGRAQAWGRLDTQADARPTARFCAAVTAASRARP